MRGVEGDEDRYSVDDGDGKGEKGKRRCEQTERVTC